MKKSTRKIGDKLETPVATIFRELGYKVHQKASIGEREIDVYAEKDNEEGLTIRYAIDCKNYKKPVGIDAMAKCLKVCDELREAGEIEKCIIVSSKGFSIRAYNKAKSKKYIDLLKIEDLSTILERRRRAELDATKIMDYTARYVPEVELADLDQHEIDRLREIVRNERPNLCKNDDINLLISLGLVDKDGEDWRPNMACILLLGKEKIIKDHLPQCEAIFLHYPAEGYSDRREQIRSPLLHLMESLLYYISLYNPIETLKDGCSQKNVQIYPFRVVREALLNALIHRSYDAADPIYVKLYEDRLEISNPGGFLRGISRNNILYHPPRHRNRKLAEFFQKINWIEGSGEGVNSIYRELLLHGKKPPGYTEYEDSITIILSKTESDEGFCHFVKRYLDERNRYFVDQLLILSFLKENDEISLEIAKSICQRETKTMIDILEDMTSRRLLERLFVDLYAKGALL